MNFFRRWKGDYLNDTAENNFYDAYRSALMKDGINQKSVLFSAPVKKFNRHGKVCFVFKSYKIENYRNPKMRETAVFLITLGC